MGQLLNMPSIKKKKKVQNLGKGSETAKCLLCKHGDLGSDLQYRYKNSGMDAWSVLLALRGLGGGGRQVAA